MMWTEKALTHRYSQNDLRAPGQSTYSVCYTYIHQEQQKRKSEENCMAHPTAWDMAQDPLAPTCN